MNLTDRTYARFALVREMMQTPAVVAAFKPECAAHYGAALKERPRVFFTGEGSSRIFPAKRAMYRAQRTGGLPPMSTDGATQALEYRLEDCTVFGASNSGRTKEVIRLFTRLRDAGHKGLFGLCAHQGSRLAELTRQTHVLGCGGEDAVAATKSVIEQALFYQAALAACAGMKLRRLAEAAKKIEAALTLQVDPSVVKAAAGAKVIYFAGRNNGVAEELTLKTNEITRKKSCYLEGTYAVHGIEEVMDPGETVVVVDPFPDEEEKFAQCLVKGVGMKVVAIAARQTSFPTVLIPDDPDYAEHIQLAAGWNLLVEIGLAAGIDLDKPQRARKIGNEVAG